MIYNLHNVPRSTIYIDLILSLLIDSTDALQTVRQRVGWAEKGNHHKRNLLTNYALLKNDMYMWSVRVRACVCVCVVRLRFV